MKYECIYNQRLDTVEVSTHGKANPASLIEMLHSIADLCRQQKSADILVDHSELDAVLLNMDDIETLSSYTVLSKDMFRKRKCAHIVARDYQFGLVRAWEIIVELKGFTEIETRVFKNRYEAIEWISSTS
jgi:hypothetical protein